MSFDAASLWGTSVTERATAARDLSDADLAEFRAQLGLQLGLDDPGGSWPYGYATSINPLLVTLGVSPGSARSIKGPDPAKRPFKGPTAGKQHPHIGWLRHNTGFGKRVCHLAQTILQVGAAAEEDACAVFGNVVLDPGRSGQARHVEIDRGFALRVLRTIRDHLRPRHLVCFGMKRHETAAGLLHKTFKGFCRREPHRSYRFCGYQRRRLMFEEWDVEGRDGARLTIVFWPQHPRRSPFSSFGKWQAACQEFAERHRGSVRS